MNRILIVYYSRSGHTEFVAKQLAARSNADLERIEDRPSRFGLSGYLRSALEALLGLQPRIERGRRRPGDYDLVVLGTPVWFWNMASPLRTWVRQHRAALKNVALFCTCGGSGHAKALNDLEHLTGLPALARLVITEQKVAHCQRDPALRNFLLELKRVPTALPVPARVQERAAV